jgi:CRP-like cAMP-binding protein
MTRTQSRNLIIQSLSQDDEQALRPWIHPARFERGTMIMSAGPIAHCLFLEDGLASLLFAPDGASPVEVGMVGAEGMLGLSVVLDSDTMFHTALAVSDVGASAIDCRKLLDLIHSHPGVHQALLKYADQRLNYAMRLAACHLRHDLERRLAGGILNTADRLSLESIAITHRQLSIFLGVTRPSVTLALQALEGEGAIWSKRNAITIRTREKLKSLSCGCHAPSVSYNQRRGNGVYA